MLAWLGENGNPYTLLLRGVEINVAPLESTLKIYKTKLPYDLAI